ncbi:MAG: sulfite exporter TauE/SafE family protein [Spirochaetes bacterium]|nr:sulfite exporter TauE/SafE family protein [Spirochaetota bacterium]
MIKYFLYILLGLTAGTLSGLLGIGGAVIIIPSLIFLFGLEQHMAQGTTLALMIPPIGIFAAWTYYQHGYVDLVIALFICLGFFIGGFIGAKAAVVINPLILKKIFGFMMLLVAIQLIFSR